MNSPDQAKSTTESSDSVDEVQLNESQTVSTTKAAPLSPPSRQVSNFDWAALGITILIAAFFALTARLNAQPATSFVPVAVLSATGCGLLVTGSRKLRTSKGAGLFEAGLGGFFVALVQFMVAITYPGVFDTLSLGQTLQTNFLVTWGLVAGLSVLFSIVGAALGHLAFAPLRTLPARSSPTPESEEEEIEDSDTSFEEHSDMEEEATSTLRASEDEQNAVDEGERNTAIVDTSEAASPRQPSRSVISYLVTILLLGLAPTVAAFVFAAAYDYTLSLNQFIPGPYPTLRLLSTMLPWQVPLPISLNGNIGNIIIFSLLWRIPLFLGNPTPFDLQALEPYIFNGAALGLLLLTIHRRDTGSGNHNPSLGWAPYLLLEVALGLVLVLPADLWVLRGLEGLLQFHNLVIPIRTLSILNPLTFSLNLITGPLVCITLGIFLKKAYKQVG
jgi:hypothetical protein